MARALTREALAVRIPPLPGSPWVQLPPELDKAVGPARELWASGVAVTLVVHEHKRLGRGTELAMLARAAAGR